MRPSAIFNIGYMPRWCIVCIDTALSFFAIILSYLLRFNFETERIEKSHFIRSIYITLFVYLVFFFIFQSFKEIIRHTTFRGILKVFFVALSASLFLMLLNIVFNNTARIVPYSVIGINFFI